MSKLRFSSEPETIEYATLYFAQEHDAALSLELFNESGPDAAADYMLDYANEEPDFEPTPPWGTADSCYWVRQEGESGLIVSVHPGGRYISLTAWRNRD